jgi:hypothetical protein
VADLFHGVNQAVALSIRCAVQTICPRLQRLAAAMGDDPQDRLELVCRVMYDMQQDYLFLYMNNTAKGMVSDIPTFI